MCMVGVGEFESRCPGGGSGRLPPPACAADQEHGRKNHEQAEQHKLRASAVPDDGGLDDAPTEEDGTHRERQSSRSRQAQGRGNRR